jgi:hypothetical protein
LVRADRSVRFVFEAVFEVVVFDEPNLAGEPAWVCKPAYTPPAFGVKRFTGGFTIRGILVQMVPF